MRKGGLDATLFGRDIHVLARDPAVTLAGIDAVLGTHGIAAATRGIPKPGGRLRRADWRLPAKPRGRCMKLRRVMAIAGCEARQLRRDKMALIRSFGVPLTLLLLFGYGLSLDVEHIPFAAIDYDHSALSRAYLYTFAGNPTFDLKSADPSERRAEAMLRRGQVRLVLIIPPDFERTLYHGLPASVQLMVDGVYPYRAEVTRAYALAAINGSPRTCWRNCSANGPDARRTSI